MSSDRRKVDVVVIAGGGTGGHVYPALAIGEELRARGLRPVFVGTKRGLESRLVPGAGFTLELIRVQGIRGRGLRGLAAFFCLPLAVWDVARILIRHRPRAVIGVGGYASGPMVAMAALVGLPTLIEEQNVVPGTTNRILGKLARSVALPSEEARAGFAGRGFVAGVPVRPELFAIKKKPAETDPSAYSCSAVVRGLAC